MNHFRSIWTTPPKKECLITTERDRQRENEQPLNKPENELNFSVFVVIYQEKIKIINQ